MIKSSLKIHIIMNRIAYIGVFLCVSGIFAQKPSPCDVPNQFYSNVSIYDHYEDRRRHFMEAYDAVTKKIAVFERPYYIIPGQKIYNYLWLYNENIVYTYEVDTHVCTKSTPTSPFRPFGIPMNATFENEYTIGGPGEAFLAQEWSDRVPLKSNERWIGVFSLHSCYPVREVSITDNDITHTTDVYFENTKIGLPNPDVFVPPKECQQAKYVQHNHTPRLTFL